MKTIYKYPIERNSESLSMPKGARILSCQIQNGTPTIWALVDPDESPELRMIEVYGTGHSINAGASQMVFIGTVQMNNGLVFHIFERTI